MCVEYLSKCLKVPKSALEIVSGHTGRTKQVLVRVSQDREAVREKIKTLSD